MAELSQRARQILYAAITEFVETGEPVGSRTLAKKAGIDLSPASIRNVLADLEEGGYLYQPHTSAGRVPTDRAFRLFIDALMQVRELTPAEDAQIRERVSSLEPGPSGLRETGKLLSELTGTAAVVMAPKAESLTLRHLRFIPTQPGELLAVLVFTNGTVQNRFLRGTVEEPELTRIHNLLDDVIEGRTLGELRDLFARRLASDRVQHDALRRHAFELGEAAVEGLPVQEADVVIEGQARLFDHAEFASKDQVKQLAAMLDEREALVRLLDATLEAKGTSVVVGREAGQLAGGKLSFVGAAYSDHGRSAGTVGVLGPTRMDYAKVVPIVAATASAMTEALGRKSRPRDDDG
jgi:heat-inducible transcriptional repressor